MNEFHDRRSPEKRTRDLVAHHEKNIDRLAQQTGVRLRGTHVEFPGGEMFPTVGAQELVEHKSEEGKPLEAHIRIPSETGRIHSISAYAGNPYGEDAQAAAVGFAEGTDPARVHWATHSGGTFFGGPEVHRDQFAGELRKRILDAGPPSDQERKLNEGVLHQLGRNKESGKIEAVIHDQGPDPDNEAGFSSHHSVYDPRTRTVSGQRTTDRWG